MDNISIKKEVCIEKIKNVNLKHLPEHILWNAVCLLGICCLSDNSKDTCDREIECEDCWESYLSNRQKTKNNEEN